jgi:drug/metabolite transporter (DMT)-like permease
MGQLLDRDQRALGFKMGGWGDFGSKWIEHGKTIAAFGEIGKGGKAQRPVASAPNPWHAPDVTTSQTTAIPQPSLMDWSLLAILLILWGSAYGMTHIGVEVLPPALLVSARLTIGAVVLGIGVLVQRASLPDLTDLKSWGVLAVIGATGTLLPFLLISTAQKTVPSALAAIYIAAAPLVVAILCHFLVPGEKLNLKRAFGVAVGFGGVCLLFAPALLDTGIGATNLTSQALLLLAAFLYASTTVMIRLVNPKLHPVAMSFCFVTMAAGFSVPFSVAAWPQEAVAMEPRHVLAILGLGVLATGLANLLYVTTIRRVGPIFMTNVGNLAPFWSIFVGAMAFGEALPATIFAALAIMLVGVWLVQRQGTK